VERGCDGGRPHHKVSTDPPPPTTWPVKGHVWQRGELLLDGRAVYPLEAVDSSDVRYMFGIGIDVWLVVGDQHEFGLSDGP